MRLGMTEIVLILFSLTARVVPLVIAGYVLLLIVRRLHRQDGTPQKEQGRRGQSAHSRQGGPACDGLTLSERLRQLRTEAGYSQELLADRLGVSRQAVSKWETGTAEPSTANLLALADLYGMTVDALLRGQRPG